MNETIEVCETCGIKAHHAFETNCRACFSKASHNPINVRLSSKGKSNLLKNFNDCLNSTSSPKSSLFRETLIKDSKNSNAIIATYYNRINDMAENTNKFYENHHNAIGHYNRAPGNFRNRRIRSMIDAALYADEASNIYYAALSLNGQGLDSWGDVHIKLKNETISHRSTILINNSYKYFAEKITNFENIDKFISNLLVDGNYSDWNNRHTLVVVKLLQTIITEDTYDKIRIQFLRSTRKREDCDFFEVHIYHSFNIQAIEAVTLIQRTKEDNLIYKKLKDQLEQLNIKCKII